MTDTPNRAHTKPRRLANSAPPSSTPSARASHVLTYMHRPPRIVPNYGKKQRHAGALPKSSISRVLLYDNVTQQQMLDVKISCLGAEQRKSGRLMDMHRKSFIVRRLQKERQLAEMALHIDHETLLPKPPVTNKPAEITGNTHTEHAPDTDEGGCGVETEAPYLVEHHVTPRLTNDSAPENGIGDPVSNHQDAPLPFISHEKRRAITHSDGFAAALAASSSNASPQRFSKTATSSRPVACSTNTVFPVIQGGGTRKGKVVLRVDTDQHGVTHMMHTFPRHNGFVGGDDELEGEEDSRRRGRRGREGRGGKLTEDDRYLKLEKLLVKIEPPNEGYLELSPSFHSPRQVLTFTRPSSFLPSSPLLRQRRPNTSTTTNTSSCRSSPSRLSPKPFLVHVEEL